MSGPRLLSFPEAVAEIGRATGRELRFVPVPIDAWTAVLAEQGIPDDQVALYRYLFTEVLDGRNASLVDGVREALGRAPRDFGEFARAASAAGAWTA